MERIKYNDFIKSIVNHEYDIIGMENDLLENGKKPTFKIVLTRGEWITKNNSQNYQNKAYYYDFDIDEIVDLMFDLLYEKEQETKKEILKTIYGEGEMEIQYEFWRWKSTIIDFSKIPDEYPYGTNNWSKKEYIFKYLPLPDEQVHRWYNGDWPTEYNDALRYAEEYGLIVFMEEEDD